MSPNAVKFGCVCQEVHMPPTAPLGLELPVYRGRGRRLVRRGDPVTGGLGLRGRLVRWEWRPVEGDPSWRRMRSPQAVALVRWDDTAEESWWFACGLWAVPERKMPSVRGVRFRCHCGGNVFARLGHTVECDACSTIYGSVN